MSAAPRLLTSLFLICASIAAAAQDSLALRAQPSPSPTPTEEELAKEKWRAERTARREQLSKQRELINLQLARLEGDPTQYPEWAREWAGIYQSVGMGFSNIIMLGPDGDYLYQSGGCLGLYDSEVGNIMEVREDIVHTDYVPTELDYSPLGGMQYFGKELALVRWGEHRYVIPTRRMVEYCDRVQSEPRLAYALFPRKKNATSPHVAGKKWPDGFPEVPEKFRYWLTGDPVSCEITEVEVHHAGSVQNPDYIIISGEVTIDAGSKQNLFQFMPMYVTSADGAHGIYLSDVQEHESRAKFRIGVKKDEGAEALPLRAGMRCSSHRE